MGRRTNLALLALLAAAFATGWLAFAFGTAPARWSLVLHALGGFAILALLPWKSIAARRFFLSMAMCTLSTAPSSVS